MSVLVHYIDDGSNFDGTAQTAPVYTGGGLFTFDAAPSAPPDGAWPYIHSLTVNIEGTTRALTGFQWAIVDRTIGVLPYDGQSANFNIDAVASATGLTSATILDDDDAGAAGDLLLNAIVGSIADDVADLVDDGGTPGAATSNCPAVDADYNPAGIRYLKSVIDTSSSFFYHRTFTGPTANGGMPELPIPPEGSGVQGARNFCALRLVSTGMSTSFGIAKVVYGYFTPKTLLWR